MQMTGWKIIEVPMVQIIQLIPPPQRAKSTRLVRWCTALPTAGPHNMDVD